MLGAEREGSATAEGEADRVGGYALVPLATMTARVCDSDYIHSKNNNTYTGLLGRIRRDPASGDPGMIGVRASRLSSSCCTRVCVW